MRTNVASGDQTDRMIKVRASLPSKGESIKNKVPSIPLKTEVCPTVWRKTDMVIPTFVIARGLESIVMDVTGEVSNKIQGDGITKWGGDTSPTFPQTDKDPLATRSRIVLEINSEKARQLFLLGKNARVGGGGGGVMSRYKLDLEMNPQI